MNLQGSSNFMNSVSSDSMNESILSYDHNQRKRKQKIKIVLVGSSDVGKTAIAQRYFFDYFPDTYNSNLEEIYKKTLR